MGGSIVSWNFLICFLGRNWNTGFFNLKKYMLGNLISSQMGHIYRWFWLLGSRVYQSSDVLNWPLLNLLNIDTFCSHTVCSSYFAVRMAWSSALNFRKHQKEQWSYMALWIWSGSIWRNLQIDRFPHIGHNTCESQRVDDFTICRWEIQLLPPVLIYSTVLNEIFQWILESFKKLLFEGYLH